MLDAHVHVSPDMSPEEAAAAARRLGYRAVGVLARCTVATLAAALPEVVRACRALSLYGEGEALPGVELVHVPPLLLAETVTAARALGAVLVVVHGEAPHTSAPLGTNLAAMTADVDILAHPGALSEDEAQAAAAHGVALELALSAPHGLFNGHVAALARQYGCTMVTGSNARHPDALATPALRRAIVRGAGLDAAAADAVDAASMALLSRCLRRGTL